MKFLIVIAAALGLGAQVPWLGALVAVIFIYLFSQD